MKKSTIKFLALAMFVFMGTFAIAQLDLTFNVDMTGVEVFNPDTDEIFIMGDFAGWTTPGEDPTYKMEILDVGSMIYTITLPIDASVVQYKYFRVIDGAPSWDNGEWTGTDNRIIYPRSDGGLTFDNVWANRPAVVTFEVDMTDADPFNPETDAVYIAGTLASGWAQPGTITEFMMTPLDGNEMVYGIDLSLYHGNYDYKFFRVIDGVASWDHGENIPNDRTTAIDTAQSDIVVSDVWSDIDAGIFDQPNVFTYNMYPNPVIDIVNIDNTGDVSLVEVFDVSGRLVRTIQVTTEKVTIDVADLQTGVYLVNVTNDKGTQSSKFIKN